MNLPRVRLSTLLVFIAIIAVLLAFWRWVDNSFGPIELIVFGLVVVILAINLATVAVMLRAFWRR